MKAKRQGKPFYFQVLWYFLAWNLRCNAGSFCQDTESPPRRYIELLQKQDNDGGLGGNEHKNPSTTKTRLWI